MDESEYLSSVPDFSLSAYLRLKDLDETGIAGKSSALYLRRELMRTLSPSHSTFVPFLRERDRMGKLLTIGEQNQPPLETPKTTLDSSKNRKMKNLPILAKPRKSGIRQKESAPSVGTYTPLPNVWVPKSFSMHKIPSLKKIPSKSQTQREGSELSSSPPPLISSFQYSVKKRLPAPKAKDKFDILRPEAALEVTKKTNFQSVRLEDTPDELRKSLQWAERRRMKDEKLFTLKRVMQQLRKGKLMF